MLFLEGLRYGVDCKKEGEILTMTVKDIPREAHFIFLSQDVDDLKLFLPESEREFDSYFVSISEGGEYLDICGMYGIVPELTKKVFKIQNNINL